MIERSNEEILKLITNTVRYYADHTKLARGLGSNMPCQYITNNGKMCAVGRCLDDPAKMEDEFDMMPIGPMFKKYGDSIFKEDYQGFNLSLWKSLQLHHDCRIRTVDLSEEEIVKIITNLYSSNTCT
jgi:hypothetical protein